ncbi:MAG TPA: MFS transporter [Cyclobacteriaceae bacterium]|nr:MFS transporter [Cyclobacteriaceae bacterium]
MRTVLYETESEIQLQASPSPASQKVYTRQFWLLCMSSMLFFSSFNMIIPELNNYLTSLGGAEYKGLIISLFTVTAGLSRPFSGKMADRLGRKPVMVLGAVVCVIISLFYPILSSVAGFLLLRLLHGFSTGFTPTGLTAYTADIIPMQRRGEAMGILSTFGTIGMSGGLAIGSPIANHISIDAMFYTSSAMALLSILIVFSMKETLPEKKKPDMQLLKIHKRDFLEPKVLAPCMVMLLSAFSFGAVLTVIPDFNEHLGIKNKGLFFTIFTLSSIVVRLLAGKVSDKYGREIVLVVSMAMLCMAMFLVGFSFKPMHLFIIAVVYGLAHGMTSPTLFAWATDLADDRFKGRAISSLYIFMEAGIGLGAVISGFMYANKVENFPLTFLVCGLLALLAFIFLVLKKRKKILHA